MDLDKFDILKKYNLVEQSNTIYKQNFGVGATDLYEKGKINSNLLNEVAKEKNRELERLIEEKHSCEVKTKDKLKDCDKKKTLDTDDEECKECTFYKKILEIRNSISELKWAANKYEEDGFKDKYTFESNP